MFIHTNNEEVIELPTDHNRVPSLHLCSTRHIVSLNYVDKKRV